MKKYIAALLCFTMIIGMAFPTSVYAAGYTGNVNGVIVEAQRAPAGVDVTSPITKDGWGEPTIHVDKNSTNAYLCNYNATPEDAEMDIYVRWDDNNLYIGVVSPDTDPRGSEDSWTGDGIQFKISAGATMSADAKNIYFTLAEDKTTVQIGANDNACKSYAHGLTVANGKMHAAIAIPFADLGMVEADIKAGAPLSFSILRISGTTENDYAGWLAWGAFFGVGNANNLTCTGDNLIVLSNEIAKTGSTLEAGKSYIAPVISDVITSDTWGKPVIHVDKNSYNATLKKYNAEPEDAYMDIYAVWDADYLYLGIVTPDSDLRGSEDSWTGDGIQFKISAGATMSADAKNIYFTLAEDKATVQIGANDNACKSYEHSIKTADGMLYAAIAIPHADLGMTAADVKAGAEYAFSILRISGTAENDYAGWLAYGAFFGANADNNPGCMTDNVIVLSGTPAETAMVVIADKNNGAFNVKDKITPDTWGVPTISVNKNSYNATLKDYNSAAEDCKMDVYLRWDASYLYIGIVSDEKDIRGSEDSWTGDGIQFKISAGTTMSADAKNIYFTLAEDKATVQIGANDNACKSYEHALTVQDDKMYASIAIPHADLGMTAADIKAGAEYSFSILRISGTTENDYAGWLAWGAFFGANAENNANCKYDNIIVLGADKAQTTAVEATRIYGQPNLEGALDEKAWGKPTISLDKDSFNTSLKRYNADPEDVTMDIYLRWDLKNLYIGVVSPETDVRGSEDSWTGDGIQFKISAGSTMSADAKNIYFTLAEDKATVQIGANDNACKSYAHDLTVENGKMSAVIAVPLADLGMVEADIKAGAKLSFSILRISATADNDYAGWLAWGAFFGANADNNPNSAYDNVIVLSSDVEMTGTVLGADKVMTKPDLSGKVTVDTWGAPSIHVDKNSYNAALKKYNADPEDIEMDIYTVWDGEYLYLGVVSPDADIRGSEDSWTGDGIQFKISAGDTMSADAKNIYFTFAEDKTTVQIGSNDNKCKEYTHNLVVEGGVMYASIAIPFADLGMTEADIKAGAPLSFSILRISGTEANDYAGWLAYGAFFGANADNNPGCATDNVIVLSDDIAETATVIKANKTMGSIDITDTAAWGAPSIHVDKNSFNAALKKYNADPEDVEMDIYTVWDGEYLYLRVVSPDADVRGSEDSWTGDGIQFKISAGNTMSADAKNIYFTFAEDKTTVQIGSNDNKCKEYAHSLVVKDGMMYASIAIPFADLGMTEADIKAGAPLSFSILRISGTAGNDYAGWLAYGAFFGANADNNPGCTTDNVIVLVDTDTTVTEEEEVFQSLILNIPKSANSMMSADGATFTFGNASSHKIVKTQNGIYTVYLTKSDVISSKSGKKSAINEFTLQKIENGSAKELAYGYTYSGLQDVVADKNGNVYVIGGSSTWDIKSMSSKYNYEDTAEKAVLNIFKYNEETGTLNGYTAYRTFANATSGYEYLGSAEDVNAGKIYTAYVGKDPKGNCTRIEYFTFDTATMQWEENSVSYSVPISGMNKVAVFAVDGGMGMICGSSAQTCFVKADGTHTVVADGMLQDVYKDADGKVNVLYTEGSATTVKATVVNADGTVGEQRQTAIDSDKYAVKFVAAGGKSYILAMDKVDPAEVILYNSADFSEAARVQLDDAVVYEAALMVAGSDIGSTDDGGITIMFMGYRGTTMGWYCATVPTEA